ncbi:MAG TPA: hypothetical protein VIW26_12055 [Gemmatimonadales bacterium]|jgi:hypothetical protein
MPKKYTKTIKAFLAEEGSLWGVVDALAEEMPGHCSASDLGECQSMLSAHGIDKDVTTIKSYRTVGRYVHESTITQARLFRTQSVSTICEFANRGATSTAITPNNRSSATRSERNATAPGADSHFYTRRKVRVPPTASMKRRTSS